MLRGSMVTILHKCILILGYAFNLKVCKVLKIENETLTPLISCFYCFTCSFAENIYTHIYSHSTYQVFNYLLFIYYLTI